MATDVKAKGDGAEPRVDPWRVNEESRRRQLREDGRRPLAVNLAEGLALSEFLSTFTGSARKNCRDRDREALKALEAVQEDGPAGN
jgi:hypothetical protein